MPRTQEYSDPHVCRLDETHRKGNRNEDIGREQITGHRCHAAAFGCRLKMSNTAPGNSVRHSRGRRRGWRARSIHRSLRKPTRGICSARLQRRFPRVSFRSGVRRTCTPGSVAALFSKAYPIGSKKKARKPRICGLRTSPTSTENTTFITHSQYSERTPPASLW